MKVLGSGANCAECGQPPMGRWQIADAYLIWACSEAHANKVKKDIWTGGIK